VTHMRNLTIFWRVENTIGTAGLTKEPLRRTRPSAKSRFKMGSGSRTPTPTPDEGWPGLHKARYQSLDPKARPDTPKLITVGGGALHVYGRLGSIIKK
jgi:hypothetical protein